MPKRGEHRPRFQGAHAACHSYVPELSGTGSLPPDNDIVSSPAVTLSLHTIGGFVAMCGQLPLGPDVPALMFGTQHRTHAVAMNGLNAYFGDEVHCVAAQPSATFLRIAIEDWDQEVAFETAVLGKLRRGYRVVRLRSLPLATRIDLCYLLVRISFSSETNNWITAVESRRRNEELIEEATELRRRASRREQEMADLLQRAGLQQGESYEFRPERRVRVEPILQQEDHVQNDRQRTESA